MPLPSQSQGNGFILLHSGSFHLRGHVLDSSVGRELWSAFTLPVKPPYHSTSQNLRVSLETEAFGSCSLISVTRPHTYTDTHSVDT